MVQSNSAEFATISATETVAQQSLDLANKLVQDNQTRVEVGTMAPIDVVQAQSQAATARQNLVAAQSTRRTAEGLGGLHRDRRSADARRPEPLAIETQSHLFRRMLAPIVPLCPNRAVTRLHRSAENRRSALQKEATITCEYSPIPRVRSGRFSK